MQPFVILTKWEETICGARFGGLEIVWLIDFNWHKKRKQPRCAVSLCSGNES
jgi:hypothetical protein